MAENTIVKQTGMGFADQLPVPDPMPANPRAEEYKKYKEVFFDPKYDGFGPELEYICNLPFRSSKDIERSPLGIGFELLDHRKSISDQAEVSLDRRQLGLSGSNFQATVA